MANIYDQFDPTPAAVPSGANRYDQFDVIPASEGAPARITVRPADVAAQPQEQPQQRLTSTNPLLIYPDLVRSGLAGMEAGREQMARGLERYINAPEGGSELARAIAGIQAGQDINYAVQRAQEETPARDMALPIPRRLAAVADILGGFGKTVAGAGEYTTAPIAAPFRSVVSQPLENVVGVPREYTEFAATLAAPVPKKIPGVAAAPESFIPARPTIPTETQLRSAGSELYQAPEVVGAPLKPPQAATDLANQIRTDLAKARANDVTADKTFRLVDRIERPPEGASFSLDNIETLRQQLGEISPVKDATGAVTNRPELRAAAIARSRIDQYIRENFPEAAPTLEKARANISAAESAATINRKQFRAELRAAAAHSGQNISNTMRSRIADILVDPAQRRGYSQGELALMDRIVRGTRTENIVRGAGKFLGGGGGLGALVTTAEGARALGPVGALAALPGAALSTLSNVMTARNIQRLNEVIRSDSPLARQMITPLSDWSRAQEAFAAAPTARNRARLTIASRNLSNNLADAQIQVSPQRLQIQGPVRGSEETEQP